MTDTPTTSYRPALDAAVSAAREAAAVLREEFHRPGGPRGTAGYCDADREAETIIRQRLAAAFPDHGVRGEELPQQDRPVRDADKHLWLVDPNDGTAAYLKGFRGASVSIALLRAGRPVLGVVFAYGAPDDDGDLLAWAEGCGPVTRNGQPVEPPARAADLSSDDTVLVSQDADDNPGANALCAAPARFRAVASVAYRLALVAAGEGRAAVSLNNPGAWDYAAGHALLQGVGLDLYDRHGRPVTYMDAGHSDCGGWCFGGDAAAAASLHGRDWDRVRERLPEGDDGFGLLSPRRGMAVGDARALDRACGCLFGQLAGDALGSLVEFRDAATIAAANPNGVRVMRDGGHWRTIAGQPTDDSEMALMLARSIVAAGAFDPAAVAQAYVRWYDRRPFDIGQTTATALGAASRAAGAGRNAAAAARAAANGDSQANGGLMRVSPLGVYAHAMEPGAAAEMARADAALTHPHPVCRDASAVFTVAVAHAVRTGDGPRRVYQFAADWAAGNRVHPDVRWTLAAAAVAPPQDYLSKMGWVLIALHNAFYRLVHAETAEEGIVETVKCGGDTDTTAAIAGALLGAVHGARAFPQQWRDRVLTCRPIRDLPGVVHPRPRDFWPVDAPMLAERLLVLGRKT